MFDVRHVALCVGCGIAASASAEIIDLGGGWQAELFTDNVELVSLGVDNGVLTIEKYATFTDLDEFTGEPVPINITFMQTADDDDTASKIVIAAEELTNNNGIDWIDFEFILVDGGNATWNPDEMAGLDILPFADSEFLDGNTIFRTFDGTVADGDTWFPGAAAGEFVIDVDLSGDAPLVFSLKEAPSVPAPGAFGLLALAGAVVARRRR